MHQKQTFVVGHVRIKVAQKVGEVRPRQYYPELNVFLHGHDVFLEPYHNARSIRAL